MYQHTGRYESNCCRAEPGRIRAFDAVGTDQPVRPGSAPVVVGLDAAGDVVSVGREVTGVHVGDLELTDGRGVDVIVDHVGGPYLADNIRCAALLGRLVGVGRLGGADGVLDLEALAFKRLSIIGVTFRTRDAAEKADIVAALLSEVDPAFEALRPSIDRILPWTEVQQAQDLMAANSHVGKIVLSLEDRQARLSGHAH